MKDQVLAQVVRSSSDCVFSVLVGFGAQHCGRSGDILLPLFLLKPQAILLAIVILTQIKVIIGDCN